MVGWQIRSLESCARFTQPIGMKRRRISECLAKHETDHHSGFTFDDFINDIPSWEPPNVTVLELAVSMIDVVGI